MVRLGPTAHSPICSCSVHLCLLTCLHRPKNALCKQIHLPGRDQHCHKSELEVLAHVLGKPLYKKLSFLSRQVCYVLEMTGVFHNGALSCYFQDILNRKISPCDLKLSLQSPSSARGAKTEQHQVSKCRVGVHHGIAQGRNQSRVFAVKNRLSCKVFLSRREQGRISVSLTGSHCPFTNINTDFCIYSNGPLGNRAGTEHEGSVLRLLKVSEGRDSAQLTAFPSPKPPWL